MRPAAVAQAEDKNAEFTPLGLFNYFVSRCRDNLHILLCMSPIGDAFRNRLRQFPSLISCCTIDWFQVCVAFNFVLDFQTGCGGTITLIVMVPYQIYSLMKLCDASDFIRMYLCCYDFIMKYLCYYVVFIFIMMPFCR